jgi:hypothetical protein
MKELMDYGLRLLQGKDQQLQQQQQQIDYGFRLLQQKDQQIAQFVGLLKRSSSQLLLLSSDDEDVRNPHHTHSTSHVRSARNRAQSAAEAKDSRTRLPRVSVSVRTTAASRAAQVKRTGTGHKDAVNGHPSARPRVRKSTCARDALPNTPRKSTIMRERRESHNSDEVMSVQSDGAQQMRNPTPSCVRPAKKNDVAPAAAEERQARLSSSFASRVPRFMQMSNSTSPLHVRTSSSDSVHLHARSSSGSSMPNPWCVFQYLLVATATYRTWTRRSAGRSHSLSGDFGFRSRTSPTHARNLTHTEAPQLNLFADAATLPIGGLCP